MLRARFADARHFWDLDRTRTLESRVPALDHVTFHAQARQPGRARAAAAARSPASSRRWSAPTPALAERAALLAKADLVTGMVGEFPELQGVMGRYYALHDGEDAQVADAIRDHYAPKGPADAVPAAPVCIAVALADKLDLLAGVLRHRREADRLGRSLRAAPRRARHHPHHPRERAAPALCGR